MSKSITFNGQERPPKSWSKVSSFKRQGLDVKFFLELGVKETEGWPGGFLGAVCVCNAVLEESKEKVYREFVLSICSWEVGKDYRSRSTGLNVAVLRQVAVMVELSLRAGYLAFVISDPPSSPMFGLRGFLLCNKPVRLPRLLAFR